MTNLIRLYVASVRVFLLARFGEPMSGEHHVEGVLPRHGARRRQEAERGLLQQHGAAQVAVLRRHADQLLGRLAVLPARRQAHRRHQRRAHRVLHHSVPKLENY